MKMQLFLIMLSLFIVGSCEAQSNLPEKMPEKVSFSLHQNGGMSRSYKKITIEDGVLTVEELSGNQREPQKCSAKISEADAANLYKAFVENKFDQIKNDERKEIVYDAGSERISISINKLNSFGVTYGKNSPLSGANLRSYQAVRKSIDELEAKAKSKDSANMRANEFETFIQGKWRVAGGNGIRAWFLEWTFDKGNFKQVGYPPILQEGKYKILSAEKDKIMLELYEQKGTFGEGKKTMEILFDSQANLLTIGQMKNFSRVGG